MNCSDCGDDGSGKVDLKLVIADLGQGAFMDILCSVCWHRRQYRAELEDRLRLKTVSLMWRAAEE